MAARNLSSSNVKMLLDTSFLVNCVKFKIYFLEQLKEHEIFLVPSVVDELNEIASGKSADSKNAKIALALTKKIKIVTEPDSTAGDADASLLELSKEGFVVATQDTGLKKKIKSQGGKIAYIRQRKIVVIE